MRVGATGREPDNANAELGNRMGFSRRMKGFSCPSSLRCFWGTEMQANRLLASAPVINEKLHLLGIRTNTKIEALFNRNGYVRVLHPWITPSSP